MSLIGLPSELLSLPHDVLEQLATMKKVDLVKHVKTAIAYADSDFEKVSIDFIDLDKKIITALKNHGVKSAGDLVNMTESEISKIPGIGKAALKKITQLIHDL